MSWYYMFSGRVLLWAGFSALLALPFAAYGEDQSPEENSETAAPRPAIYLPVKPAFVVNYGGAGRLRYLKAEVSIRLANIEAAEAARYHMPYLRNNLVLLFASQSDENVSSQDGKEKIRLDALNEVRNLLETEERIPRDDVIDLYFNSFIVQK